MSNLEIKINRLIENIILLQGKTDKRQKLIEAEHWKSRQAMEDAARSLDSTVRNIKSLTADTVNEALARPLQELGRNVEMYGTVLTQLAERADLRQREAENRLRRYQWMTLAALFAAAVVCIGSAFFMMKHAKTEVIRAEWVGDINRAVEQGNLSYCENGRGLCAKVKGRWVRLDK